MTVQRRQIETPMSAPDVVVVGGGVIGLSIAWRAAQRSLEVVLVDEDPGRGASWAAAGMLAPVTEVHYGEEPLQELNAASLALYPDFVEEIEAASGESTGYRRSGTLIVAPDRDDYAALNDLFAFQKSLNLDAERLSVKELRDLEPRLSPRIRGGFGVRGDDAIDSRALGLALVTACRAAGARLIAGRVERVVVEGERATGVELSDGSSIRSGTVVLAAGCWSGSIPGIPERFLPPVRPVKGQLVYLRGPSQDFLSRTIRGLDVYIVPRLDGRIAIGATVEEQGFDLTVTAGAVYTLLRDAYELIPDLMELELLETVAGLRPGSPDNAPMIGASSLEGLVVATGHYRNGILLAPVTSEAVAELLTGGSIPDRVAPFSPRRFERTEVRT